ncbi:STAS domain-containing protein [Candidatus Peregrinibacteria bacterium]|jgi:anti-anti-sigma factor|nr:STAS domain-containing protein [Candidatus Peregrinibacteria bacterium]MBT7736070.1 STAS domain-containing protein [Candidatus Peregrinibacteria bacterium]
MQKNLTIEKAQSGTTENYDVIKFSGEFDKAGHSDVKADLETLVKAFDKKILVFDFAGLKFINSEGIGYLMEIHAHLMKKDKKLVIVGMSAHVEDVFKTIGIQEIITLYPTLKDFKDK